MDKLTLILENIRSAHNVGAIARSAAAFGVIDIYCVGITPYPAQANDRRLPHVMNRATKQIAKTALGAESSCTFTHYPSIEAALKSLPPDTHIFALEQTGNSQDLRKASCLTPAALLLGNEVEGVSEVGLMSAKQIFEITHSQHKESLNVAAAAAIALYQLADSIN